MNSLPIGAAAAAMFLVSCGSPAQTDDNGANSEATFPSSTMASQQRGRPEEAAAFLVARTTRVDHTARVEGVTTNNGWWLGPASFTDKQWAWTEEYENTINYDPSVESLAAQENWPRGTSSWQVNYSLDPSDLSYPAQALQNNGRWYMRFECAIEACIAQSGDRHQPTQLSQNSWRYTDQESAERAARAMSVLIQASGGREQAF